MSDFVRLRVSATQSIEEGKIHELVVNREHISHLIRRDGGYTAIHFANGTSRTLNVVESPTDIRAMAPLQLGT